MENSWETTTKRQKNYSFSYLRAVAALAIVFLHTFQYESEAFGARGALKIASITMRNMLLWAVPCFVMVSGALLLNPDRKLSIRKLFSKYISRILAALVVSSLIYTLVDAIIRGEGVSMRLLLLWLRYLYTGEKWKVLWYLYMLLALYLMLPIYRRAAEGMTRSEWYLLLIVLLIFQQIIPMLNRFTGITSGFYIFVFSTYTFYFYVGYAIYKEIIRLPVGVAWLIFIAGTLIDAGLTIAAFLLQNEAIFENVNSYAFIATALTSVGLFSLVCVKGKTEEETPRGRIGAFLLSVDSVTLEIYLIHYIFILIVTGLYSLNGTDGFSSNIFSGLNSYRYGLWMTFIHGILFFLLSYPVGIVVHKLYKKIIRKGDMYENDLHEKNDSKGNT